MFHTSLLKQAVVTQNINPTLPEGFTLEEADRREEEDPAGGWDNGFWWDKKGVLRVRRERNWQGGIVPGLCSVTGLEGSLEQLFFSSYFFSSFSLSFFWCFFSSFGLGVICKEGNSWKSVVQFIYFLFFLCFPSSSLFLCWSVVGLQINSESLIAGSLFLSNFYQSALQIFGIFLIEKDLPQNSCYIQVALKYQGFNSAIHQNLIPLLFEIR